MGPELLWILIAACFALAATLGALWALGYVRSSSNRLDAAREVARLVDEAVQKQRAASGPRAEPDEAFRLCSSCADFDLAEGQAMIKSHPAFAEVTRWLGPADMATGNDELELGDPARVPRKASFTEFGLCRRRHFGLWGGMDPKRRLVVLKDDERGELDCWTQNRGGYVG